ncbi:hypothetical protein VF12_27665, partial [Nostoc linckia z15]
KYKLRNKNYLFFKERVLIPTLFTCNPRRAPLPFHVSDCFQVGNLSDLQDLWNIPLAPEPDTTRYFQDRSRPFIFTYSTDYLLRYVPEQYIWITFLKKKYGQISLDYHSDINLRNFFTSELSIVNNFIILDALDLGVYINKEIMNSKHKKCNYSFKEWESLYQICSKEHTLLFYTINLFMQFLIAIFGYNIYYLYRYLSKIKE